MKAIIILLILALFSLLIVDSQQNDMKLVDFTYVELDLFLFTDTTDKNTFESDAHAARELSQAAHAQGYNLGAAILGNHQTFGSGYNGVYNYVIINSKIIFINAKHDDFMDLDDIRNAGRYNYIKLYEDGTKVPFNVRKGLSHDIDLTDM